jgi:hypothetical protein
MNVMLPSSPHRVRRRALGGLVGFDIGDEPAEPNLPTRDRWWEDVEADRPQSVLPLGHPLRG